MNRELLAQFLENTLIEKSKTEVLTKNLVKETEVRYDL